MSRTTATNIRRRIKQQVDELAADRLPVAEDFLSYLQDRKANAATRELLRIPGILNELKRAERDVAHGRVTPVNRLRRKK